MLSCSAAQQEPFTRSIDSFFTLVRDLGAPEAAGMTLTAAETMIAARGLAVMRQLIEDHLALRGRQLPPETIVGSDREIRTHRIHRPCTMMSVFGRISWQRTGCGGHGMTTLFPGDSELNLPSDSYSHGVKKVLAGETARASFDDSLKTLEQFTGAHVPKRQVEEIAAEAAVDFEVFYEARKVATPSEVASTGPILALSTDNKGIVMRTEDLREATRKAAEAKVPSMEKRLSPGEKKNRKRMTTVATIYTVEPHVRTPEEIVKVFERPVHDVAKAPPRPENRRVFAHVEKEPEEVIEDLFAEAARRDPDRTKTWTVAVDGATPQLRLILKVARRLGVKVIVVLDIIHVIEYLWKAARVLAENPGAERENWVQERLLEILRGHASLVAAGMRRSATLRKITPTKRAPVDKCAQYILNHTEYMRYAEYLAAGLPIASGSVEGACRHLVQDRMDVTGARWSLRGAEAILRLRSLRASGDFDEYWEFHERREWERNHEFQYLDPPLPRATILPPTHPVSRRNLRRIK